MLEEEIIVAGAGASGMMAAVTAAQNGGKVLLLEKMKKPGKKLLATGNGRCNFTNRRQERDCYRGSDTDFIWESLDKFSQEDTLRVFHEMGILPTERDGYYYPASGQASSVVDAFVRRMGQGLQESQNQSGLRSVRLHVDEPVKSIRPFGNQGAGFLVKTARETYHASKVILSMGGSAAPIHGTTGDGYDIVQKMGLDIAEPLPALTSCALKGNFMKEWAGVRISGCVSLFSKSGEYLAEDTGELQMVSYGISGIPVFQISRYAACALAAGDKPYLMADIMPSYTQEELERELTRRRKSFPKWTALDVLDGMMHRKLAGVLLKSLGIDAGICASQWGSREIVRIAERMKGWKLGIAEVGDFEKAQVTCGGVLTGQINPDTMEVKSQPGLYITGELLDVDGICGGYNLQWAWTSGYLAGKSAAEQERVGL